MAQKVGRAWMRRVAAALAVWRGACESRAQVEEWRGVAAWHEAAALGGVAWSHPLVGPHPAAAGLPKGQIRSAMVAALGAAEHWGARQTERQWRQEYARKGHPLPRPLAGLGPGTAGDAAALFWPLASRTERAIWAQIIRAAARRWALGRADDDRALADEDALLQAGVRADRAGIVSQIRAVDWPVSAVPRRLYGLMRAAVVEGWGPPVAPITLHTGPMGAGKSTALIAARMPYGHDLWVAQAAINGRDGAAIRSHDGMYLTADVVSELGVWLAAHIVGAHEEDLCRATMRGAASVRRADVIGDRPVLVLVDEGQWHGAAEWRRVLALATCRPWRVEVAALDWSAAGRRMGSWEVIEAIADHVVAHAGACADCGAPSTLTRWDGAGPPGVGAIGPGAYRPVCAAHWRAPVGGAG
jgi:thymidine kinase